MAETFPGRSCGIYKIDCGGGRRYVIYNSSEIGSAFDHVLDKWYFLPYPVPLGLAAGMPFDTADEAERAARAQVPGLALPERDSPRSVARTSTTPPSPANRIAPG